MTERNQGIRKLPEGIGIVKVSNIHCKKWIVILTKLTQQKRTCKIMQDCARILHARLAWHVHAVCPFSCTILAQSGLHIYCAQDLAHILQEMVQDFVRDAARIITCKFGVSCTFFCKILQELVQDCGTYRVHVPSKSCMQDSCTILHDLASSFLLGSYLSCLTPLIIPYLPV